MGTPGPEYSNYRLLGSGGALPPSTGLVELFSCLGPSPSAIRESELILPLESRRRGLLGGGWDVALRHPGARTEAGPAEHRRPRPERATQPRAPHRLLASGIAVGSRPVGGIFAPAGRRGTAVYILMVA